MSAFKLAVEFLQSGKFDPKAFAEVAVAAGYAEATARTQFRLAIKHVNAGVAPAHITPVEPIIEESDDEMLARITKRFDVMEKMTTGVIAGTIRSLIISGAPGISKTFTVEKMLTEAADRGVISFEMLKIKVSAFMLYCKLYEMKEAGDVLVLDDVDVFGDQDTLNVLKAALDTGSKRILTWGTASSYLDENDIPRSFEYEGTIMFITNTDMDHEIQRGTKISPHLDALQSRSIYLDLGCHSPREIMCRVKSVVANTTMMTDRGISQEQSNEAMAWMVENMDKLRSVSLRTALYIADFINTDPVEWKDVCEVTLRKGRAIRV